MAVVAQPLRQESRVGFASASVCAADPKRSNPAQPEQPR